jgi:hypothetical protein
MSAATPGSPHPIFVVKKGRLSHYFTLNPNSRKKLPPGATLHCLAISPSDAARLATIFNQDQHLTFASGKTGVRKPRPGRAHLDPDYDPESP